MCPFELLHGRSEAVADRYPEFSTAEIQEHLFGRRCCVLRQRQGVAVLLRACAEIKCREYRSCLLRPERTGTHLASIAVDSGGSIYLAGSTRSSSFAGRSIVR